MTRLLVLVLAFLTFIDASAGANDLMEIVGWKEMVKIPAFGATIATKNDTGAESASLHAENVERFEKNGEDWIRFDAVLQEQDEDGDKARKVVRHEAPVVDTVLIKQKDGPSERRYVIELDLCMGHVRRMAEVNLEDRSGFSTRMLLGREFLEEAVLVDASRELVREPWCPPKHVTEED